MQTPSSNWAAVSPPISEMNFDLAGPGARAACQRAGIAPTSGGVHAPKELQSW
ncbi:hypothetical protein B0H12DRAFT_1091582 [Mycena haematopus]|nr:hypothetical protein B0H12DRAFT_1091582 [Mycena haematopus]